MLPNPRLGSGSSRARVAFFRCFATLLAAGVPLRRALDVTIERCDERALRAALGEILVDVERGDPISAALARRPRHFSPLVVAMIAAGEAGGLLDEALERIAQLLERDFDLQKRVIAALAYPAAVFAASLALLTFLLVRVVPMFAAMFGSFHVEMPPITRALLAAGNALDNPLAWVCVGVTFAGLFALCRRAQGTQRGKRLLDRVRLRIPFAGRLLRMAVQARLARMLGTLVRSGVDLNAALPVITPLAGSQTHADALARVATAIREGEALTPTLAACGLFDPMLIALVGAGEETGMLDTLLIKAADYFDADVAATIVTLGSVAEPVLIVFLGAIVAFIVSSVFIPLYTLLGGVSP